MMSFQCAVRIVATTLLLLSISSIAQQGTKFEAGCQLPFESIALEHKGFDDSCGIGGVASSTDVGNQQQNRIKNSFCLNSKPIALKPQDLATLQKKVDALSDFKFGSGLSVPTDRSPLRNISLKNGLSVGEGTLVVVVGYMIDPHYSDVKNGEGVNCKHPGNEPNDIHFNIGSKWVNVDQLNTNAKMAQLCKLVSGEISPHFRPESWEVDHLDKLTGIPVRLTGQLFFDASHVPCRPNKPVNPARSSVWEIHPIYSVDVCKTKKQCRVDIDSDWKPLSDFAKEADEKSASERDQ